MTDTAAADTRTIVHRRLIGLMVLLLMAFVLSLLLRVRPNVPDALPSVVIPLNGSSVSINSEPNAGTAPMLDAPEPELEAQPAQVAPAKLPAPPVKPVATPQPAAKLVTKPAEKTPVTKKPVAARPSPKIPPPTAAAAKPAPPVSAAAKPAAARWFVAVGAYKDPMAAQAIANRIKLAGFAAGTAAITSAGERLHRVRAGPFASKADAESARVTLIVEGLTKAALVSEK